MAVIGSFRHKGPSAIVPDLRGAKVAAGLQKRTRNMSDLNQAADLRDAKPAAGFISIPFTATWYGIAFT